MYILNKVSAVKELKDFIFENYYQQMGFARENSYYSMKHLEIARFTLKSVPIEHPKTSRKSFKTITQTKTFSQVVGAGKNSTSPLYSETAKSEYFLDKKMQK